MSIEQHLTFDDSDGAIAEAFRQRDRGNEGVRISRDPKPPHKWHVWVPEQAAAQGA